VNETKRLYIDMGCVLVDIDAALTHVNEPNKTLYNTFQDNIDHIPTMF